MLLTVDVAKQVPQSPIVSTVMLPKAVFRTGMSQAHIDTNWNQCHYLVKATHRQPTYSVTTAAMRMENIKFLGIYIIFMLFLSGTICAWWKNNGQLERQKWNDKITDAAT